MGEHNMRKEHAIAIFFGLIMVTSAAGFALSGINANPTGSKAQPSVPSVIERPLTLAEMQYVLKSGAVIIRDHYPSGCAENCSQANQLLGDFTDQMNGTVVLERFAVGADNETSLEMVGSDGTIVALDQTQLSQAYLLDKVCTSSYAQTRECLMRNI
jgi:hypothetical protein